MRCDYLVGADGSRSICRFEIPPGRRVHYFREYPFAWFGILAQAPKNADELIYTRSDRGFALISQRTETMQRMYLQCAPDENVGAWSDDRIWAELHARVAGADGFVLHQGPITDKAVLRFRSFVAEPMRHGRLLLAGDAAHTVPPTGAKGLNLALADVRVLADTLERTVIHGDHDALEEYGPRALQRVWRAQHFSYWMTTMLHRLPTLDFDARRRSVSWTSLSRSRAGATVLAEGYTVARAVSPRRPREAEHVTQHAALPSRPRRQPSAPSGSARARQARADGEITVVELREVEDAAVRAAVAMQESVGLQSATDGEFRRTSWHMDFIYSLGGVDPAEEKLTVHFRNETGDVDFESAALRVHQRVTLPETIFADAFSFLAGAVTTAIPKLTIPSPSMVDYRGGPASLDPAVYADREQFWADLIAAYRAQLQGVYDLGCRYLQLDDTSLAYLNDPAQRAMIAARGDDAEHQHERYIRTINAVLADRPADLRVTAHLCRGNYR